MRSSPKRERAMAHLRIGRLLASRRRTPEEIEENIFDIVNQFDRGAALIATQEEREQVAELNLMAGKRAKAASAYASALQYFSRRPRSAGGQRMGAVLPAHVRARAQPGRMRVSDRRAGIGGRTALRRCRLARGPPSTLAAVTCVRVNLYTILDQSDSAVEVGLDYLRRVDGQWSLHATAEDVRQEYDRLWRRLGPGSIEALLDLPLMSDPDRRATMDVLTALALAGPVHRREPFPPRHRSDGDPQPGAWQQRRIMPRLCVAGRHPRDRTSATTRRVPLRQAWRWIWSKSAGSTASAPASILVFAVHVAHWTQHLPTCRAFLRRAFEAAQNAGDLTYAAYSCVDLITNLLASGDPLSEVEREAESALEFVRKVRFGLVSDVIIAQLRLVRMLRGLTPDFNSFNDAEFDEGDFEHIWRAIPGWRSRRAGIGFASCRRAFYAGDYASAVAAASKADVAALDGADAIRAR